jgi:ornithine cyclodeaminase
VLQGQAPDRKSAPELSLFDLVGFALEDYSAQRFMGDIARERGPGQWVSLIPSLPNPKTC